MADEAARLIAIGDVHGCAHALDALLETIQPQPADHLVFLGDLIDHGRDSADVLDRLLELPERCQVTLIQGNHEEMLFAARDSEQSLRYWENCGGVATLNSYRFGALVSEIPDKHWDALRSAAPYVETEQFIFTHANYQADLPMDQQESYQLRWDLFDPDHMHPHHSGKTVIVGHTEQKNSEILDLGFAICIDTACWRYGWLTALDVHSRDYWQASRWGILREEEEPTHRGRLPQFERPC
ncbi:MAG: metallophosphoesterase family protein [Planctomycetaceae bacterium]